jgi:hypothetical protein
MNDPTEMLFVVAIVAVLVVIVVASWIARKRRREAMQAVANRLGLHFEPGSNKRIVRQLNFLDQLRQGHGQYARNILRGEYHDHSVMAFDFHYTTGSGKNRQHHEESFFVLTLPQSFPELRVYPENFLSKIGQAFGYADIDFESVEFSDAFTVRSKDKKFAYDVCHTRMMEFMLKHRSLSFEIERDYLTTGATRRLEPPQIQAGFDRLIQLHDLMPNYLFENTRN